MHVDLDGLDLSMCVCLVGICTCQQGGSCDKRHVKAALFYQSYLFFVWDTCVLCVAGAGCHYLERRMGKGVSRSRPHCSHSQGATHRTTRLQLHPGGRTRGKRSLHSQTPPYSLKGKKILLVEEDFLQTHIFIYIYCIINLDVVYGERERMYI